MGNYLWYFELTAPSTVDLIDRIDRVTIKRAETGVTPPRYGIVPPPFRFLVRPRPPDLRQVCFE